MVLQDMMQDMEELQVALLIMIQVEMLALLCISYGGLLQDAGIQINKFFQIFVIFGDVQEVLGQMEIL